MAVYPYVGRDFAVLAYIGGVYVNLTADVLVETPLQWKRGQTSNAANINTASPGTFTFALNNGPNNSVSTVGYYSPWHAARMVGWHLGVKILLMRNSSSTYEFTGWVTRLDPVIGSHVTPAVRVTCGDIIDVMGHQIITTATPTLLSSSYALAFNMLAGAVPVTQQAGIVAWDDRLDAAGPAYMLDTIRRDRPTILSELQKLAASTYARIFCLGDNSICYQVKPYYSGAVGDIDGPTYGGTINTYTANDITSAHFPMDRSTIVNTVRGQVAKRTVDSINVTLFQVEAGFNPPIGAGKVFRLKCHFTDPNNSAQRIGGASVVTPVATTDYTFNSLANGTGTNLTANISVAIQVNGADAVVTFTNNAAVTAFLTSFKIRGKGLYTYNPRKAEVSDPTSIDVYGSTTLMIDMTYQELVESFYVLGDGTKVDNDNGSMREVLRRFAAPTPLSPSISFNLTINTGLANYDLARIVGAVSGLHNTGAQTAIRFTDTPSGIDEQFIIIGIEKTYDLRTNTFLVTWYLDPIQPPYTWTVGASGLGEDTILG